MKLINLKEGIVKEEKSPEQVLSEYYDIDNQIKELDKKKKELRELIIDNDEGEYEIGEYTLKLTERNGMRFDAKLAKAYITLKGEDMSKFETESNSKTVKVIKN